jgi:apoptosis-inducing factor 2
MSSREYANIVVLGGSYAGLSVTHRLLTTTIKELRTTKSSPRYRVVLVSPSTHLYWNIGAPRAICGAELVSKRSAFIPFLDEFKRYPDTQFSFIQGEAVSINFVHRTVEIKMVRSRSASREEIGEPGETEEIQDITYHALIIATGTSSDSDLLSLHGSHDRTAKALKQFHRDLKNASSLVIIGGGPSGVECAGQIATWVNQPKRQKSKEQDTKRSKKVSQEVEDSRTSIAVKITLISGHNHLLPDLNPGVGAKAERQLKQLGVHIINNVRLVTAQQIPSQVIRCVLSNGMILSSDLLISATGQTPNTAFLPRDILDDNSYVALDPKYMRVTGAGERVYAIGSCCSIQKNTLGDIFRGIPVLIHNLRNDLREFEIRLRDPLGGKKGGLQRLRDVRYNHNQSTTQLCPITRKGGVGVVHGLSIPSLAVWLLKGRDYQFSKAGNVVALGKKPATPI